MRYSTLLLLGLLSYALSAQQRITPTFDTITVEYNLWEVPYLHLAAALDTSETGIDPHQRGNYLSFSGHPREATRVMEERIGSKGMDTARYERFRDEFRPVPAVPTLLAAAENHEIVIINEAHHEPRHRVFTRMLLEGLYQRGYRHLGLETLGAWAGTDSLDHPLAYPELGAGYYTRDPQFAALVHTAQRIGYRIFGYEAQGTGSPKERELGQMRNIVAYRADHPEGKLLLHVGYSHALEGELGGAWEKAMAQRLADTTGLDPLTVDQTIFREMSDTSQERYEYRRFAPEEIAVFRNEAGGNFRTGDGKKWFDYHVFYPRTSYRHGRPDYVFAFSQQPVYLDFSHIDTPGPWLVQAYRPEDGLASVVPRDVVEMTADDERALALVPGKYRLLVTSPGGEQWVSRITVGK
jgi:hypothetical protein